MEETKLESQIMYIPELHPANLIMCEIFDAYTEEDEWGPIEYKIVKTNNKILLVREAGTNPIIESLAAAAGLKSSDLQSVRARKIKTYRVLKCSTL